MQHSLLSIGPKVWSEGHVLCARTDLITIFTRLGIYWISFRADIPARTFHVTRHYLAFSSTRSLPFDRVRRIIYNYHDTFGFLGWLGAARDSRDHYRIGLETWDDEEIMLFDWVGEGEFRNDSIWPDFVYWKEFAFDMTGTQKKESLLFYDALCAMIKPKGVQRS